MGAGLNRLRTAATLLLPALALLLLGAHFLRAGQVVLTAVSLGLLILLLVRDGWAARVLQAALWLGALEWLRTAWVFASARAQFGQPYGRLLVILGGVAAFTAVAALVLRSKAGRAHFRL